MKTLAQLIAEHGIRMTCEYADRNPNMSTDGDWHLSASHWKCTFRNKAGRRMTCYFSQGSAHVGEPKLSSVLDCLASDAAGIDNARGFEDWVSEYGYDTDSRKAERTYKVCEAQYAKLRQFMGSEYAFKELLFGVERE